MKFLPLAWKDYVHLDPYFFLAEWFMLHESMNAIYSDGSL